MTHDDWTPNVRADHECGGAVEWDETTAPAPNGAVTVTEHCACGATIRTYTDWVL